MIKAVFVSLALMVSSFASAKLEPGVYSDRAMQTILKASGIDLNELWDTHFHRSLSLEEQRSLTDAAEARDAKLVSKELMTKLRTQLSKIKSKIEAREDLGKLIKPVWLYFTGASIARRINLGDEYILDRPSTPVDVAYDRDGELVFHSKAFLSQSHEAFKSIEGERMEPKYKGMAETTKRVLSFFFTYLRLSNRYLIRPAKALMTSRESRAFRIPEPGRLLTDDEMRSLKLPSYDYSNRSAARQENQLSHGTCWMFAAKRLVEEQICKFNATDPLCRDAMSVLDLGRDTWKFLTPQEGGLPSFALKTCTEGGVCPDRFALYPNRTEESIINKRIDAYYKEADKWEHPESPLEQPKCLDYAPWQVINFGNGRNVTLSPALMEVAQEAAASRSCPIGSTLKETRASLYKCDKSVDTAFRDTFVGEPCKQNRVTAPFEGLDYTTLDLAKMTTQQRIEAIVKFQQQNKNSVALGMCSRHYQGNRRECGAHAIVMDGVRYNEGMKIWEGHFRNSWGTSKVLNGWIQLDKVLRHTWLVEGFVSKTAKERS